MKTIKEIQEENRKIIKNCLMLHCEKVSLWTDEDLDNYHELSLNGQQQLSSFYQNKTKEIYDNIFGKSELLTLNKLLIALEEKSNYLYIDTEGNICSRYDTDLDYDRSIVRWDLNKETLEEQTEEAQRAINKLLCKNAISVVELD